MARSKSEKKKRKAKKKDKDKAMKARPDKHVLYQESVQNPDYEVGNFKKIYKKLRGKTPCHLREDFCGTALISCSWVRKIKGGTAQGIDLDAPTLEWGREHNVNALGDLADRVELVNCDVLEARGPAADVIAAVNFSYFVFKEREQLLGYLRAARESLAEDGILILDLYGGPDAQMLQVEDTRYDGFTYVWDQDKYNPITGETMCHIHFRLEGGKTMKRAFTYDWRLWSLPEIRDALRDAGFGDVTVFWEGTDRKTGEGNGTYRISTKGDNATSWIAYVAASV